MLVRLGSTIHLGGALLKSEGRALSGNAHVITQHHATWATAADGRENSSCGLVQNLAMSHHVWRQQAQKLGGHAVMRLRKLPLAKARRSGYTSYTIKNDPTRTAPLT